MDKVNKQWLKTLRYFANHSRAIINARKEEIPDEYKENVPIDLEKSFSEWGYLDLSENSKSRYIITKDGLQQLRELEQVYQKDMTYKIAIGSLIVAFLSAYFAYKATKDVTNITNLLLNSTLK